MASEKSFTIGTSWLHGVTVLLIVAKMVGLIEWSWLWVLAPSWIPISVGLVCLLGFALLFLLVCGVIAVVERYRYGKWNVSIPEKVLRNFNKTHPRF